MLYSMARANITMKGFTGFRPGTLIKLDGDILFDGIYMILNVDHYLSQDEGFKSDLTDNISFT